MTYHDANGVRLFFTDSAPESERRPLVFVHGWTCDSHDWSWQLAELATSHRVVALDLRGHGRSDVPERGFTLQNYVDDVISLLTSLGGPPGVVIGHSMGALVSSLIADQQPQLICGLVVVDPPYGLDKATCDVAREFARRVYGVDGVQATHDWLIPADSDNTPPWLATWHRRRILSMPHHALIETVRDVHDNPASIVNEHISRAVWARRTVPVLVVTASESTATREVPYFRDPCSRAVHLDDVGHWLQQEKPAEFNALLDTWVKDALPL
jgi:pimeloyl-ACP methyl ester carboxylesterase